MSIRLVVADDHEVVRRGLRTMFQQTDIEVVGEAASGQEAVGVVQQCNPDVVVLDVRMTNGDGLSALSQIKQHKPELPVLVLSTYDNPTFIARAIALGASGYMLKGSSRDELLQAIRTVASGQEAWTRRELRRYTGALATPRVASDVEVSLTQRESEVLAKMATGQTNKEIAQALQISYETVKEHVQHILRKLGVTDRTQAAVWAVRKGLV